MGPQTLSRRLTLPNLQRRPSYLRVAGDNCETLWGADKEKKAVKQIENFVITTWDKTYEGNTLVIIIEKLLIKIQGTGKDSPRW